MSADAAVTGCWRTYIAQIAISLDTMAWRPARTSEEEIFFPKDSIRRFEASSLRAR